MKCKRFVIVALGAVLTLAFTMTGMTAENPAQPKLGPNVESKTVVDFPLSVKFKRPAGMQQTKMVAVNFTHPKHQKVPCMTCHHTWDGKGEIVGCASQGCHDNTTRYEEQSYFQAFHNKESNRSCVGCHTHLNSVSAKKIKLGPCADNACHSQAKAKK